MSGCPPYKFPHGSVVRLRSGGPPMTVGWRTPGAVIGLAWIGADGELRHGQINDENMLEAAEAT